MTKYSEALLEELDEVAKIHRSLAILETPDQHLAIAELLEESANYIRRLTSHDTRLSLVRK